MRQRHGLPNGDLDRITRQQVFLAGATSRLLSAGTLANPFALDRLTGVMARSVTLDSGWDVLSFAAQMQALSAGSVTFRTIPTGTDELSTPEDGQAVKVDPARVRTFVTDAVDLDSGITPPPAGPATPSDSAVARAAQEDDGSSSSTQGSSEAGSSEAGSSEAGSSEATTAPAPPAPVTPPITAAAPGCVN